MFRRNLHHLQGAYVLNFNVKSWRWL